MSLLCTPYKIYERIVEERLKEKIEITLNDTQAAFRANKSTQDWIFVVRQIAEKITATNSKVYACTVDLEKAFDSIHREDIWMVLQERKIGGKMIKVLKSMYEGTLNTVQVGGGRTESFITKKGLDREVL